MKDFTKADLKNRMIVETRRSDRFIVIDNILVGKTAWSDLADYKDDLTYPKYDSFDIVKVYDQVNYINKYKTINTLWERPEIKEVTMSEIEEKFGCKVKIVRGEPII